MDQRGDWRITDALVYEHGRGDPFAAAVRATRMSMLITNPRLPDNPIIFCNEAFQHLSGYDLHEIVGSNCRFLQGPDTDPATVDRVRAAIVNGTDVAVDLLNYRKDGTTFWNALYLSPVRDDAGEITYFFASQLDVTDRVMAHHNAVAHRKEVEREVAARTAELASALEAKTQLLHELDHRVKNNLTMIGSLLRLQSRAADDPAISTLLEEMLRRVDALGIVHRRLYQSAEITRFDVSAFIQDLAADLVAAAPPGRISLIADMVPIEIAPGHASAIGLVLNEILNNTVQHAFAEDRPGTLRLHASIQDQTARLEITDDGPGIAGDTVKGLGRTLVDRLSRQIGIETSWTSSPAGTRVSLSFPLGRPT